MTSTTLVSSIVVKSRVEVSVVLIIILSVYRKLLLVLSSIIGNLDGFVVCAVWTPGVEIGSILIDEIGFELVLGICKIIAGPWIKIN